MLNFTSLSHNSKIFTSNKAKRKKQTRMRDNRDNNDYNNIIAIKTL